MMIIEVCPCWDADEAKQRVIQAGYIVDETFTPFQGGMGFGELDPTCFVRASLGPNMKEIDGVRHRPDLDPIYDDWRQHD